MYLESFTSSKIPLPHKFPVATHVLLLCDCSGFHLCQNHSNSSCMTCLVSGLPGCSSLLSPYFSQGALTANTEACRFSLAPQTQIRCQHRFQRAHLIFISLHQHLLLVTLGESSSLSFSPVAILLPENHTPGFRPN